VLHDDRTVLEHCQQRRTTWRADIGLTLHEAQSHISHPLAGAQPGFDFLGCVRHEVAYTAVMTPKGGHNLVCGHQYPPQTCGWSNPAV
jgi:hypothetical protein